MDNLNTGAAIRKVVEVNSTERRLRSVCKGYRIVWFISAIAFILIFDLYGRRIGRASTDDVAEFYAGRNIDFIVGSGVGGGYDLYARVLARWMAGHIPGKPNMIIRNVVGAGGIRATNLIYNVSPRDGSVMGTVSRAMITAPLTGVNSAKFDPTKLTWIGNITGEDSVCVTWKTAPVNSWQDLLHTKLVVGTAAQGTTTYAFPVMLKNMFSANFEIVSGYPDGAQAILALERGEIDAVCPALSTIRAMHPQWLVDATVKILVLISLKRRSDLPNVPAVVEFTNDPEKQQLLKFILGPELIGRPLIAPPDLPADRVKALREAFMITMEDPEFRAETAKQRLDLDPTGGGEIQNLVSQIVKVPPEIASKAESLLAKSQ
jgi:tripartite-type tricarboxylate transporter receptor subunit TctC